MSSSPPKNAALRKYLDEKEVATIIESFIVACGQHKPDDVHAFMEQWAAAQVAKTREAAEQQRGGHPEDSPRERQLALLSSKPALDVVREGWAALEKMRQIVACQNFFTVLTTQHPTLKRTLFKDVDTTSSDLAIALAGTFTAYLDGAITIKDIRAISKKLTAQRSLEERHLNYFLTAALTALHIVYEDDTRFTTESEAWRVELTHLLAEINDATQDNPTGHNHAADKEDFNHSFIGASSPFEVVAASWANCLDKRRACQTFFSVLFTQHSSVKRHLFDGTNVDNDGFLIIFEDFINKFLQKEMSIEQAEELAHSLGGALVDDGKLQPRHFQYFLTAALTTLSIVLGEEEFSNVQQAWATELRFVLDKLSAAARRDRTEAAAVDEKDKTLTEMASEHYGDKKTNNNDTEDQQQQQQDGANNVAPFDAVQMLWASLSQADRVRVAEHFFTVLLTQHQSLHRTILHDIDPKEYYDVVANAFGLIVDGEFTEIRELAAKHAAPRHVQQRHLHYFICAGMSAFSLILPQEKFLEVQRALQVVMTHICDEIWYGIEHHEEVLAGRHPVVICKEYWGALGDKEKVCKSFFTVLFTQKPSLKRTLFKDIDTESQEIVSLFVDTITAALDHGIDSAELKRLGEEHGKPRGVEYRHFQSFLTAAMSALNMTYMSGWVPSVANPWKSTVQLLCNGLMEGAGCAP